MRRIRIETLYGRVCYKTYVLLSHVRIHVAHAIECATKTRVYRKLAKKIDFIIAGRVIFFVLVRVSPKHVVYTYRCALLFEK